MTTSYTPRAVGGPPAAKARLLADTQAFAIILSETGIFNALRFLNQRTPHRFTGIYRFVGDYLENTHLYDRQDSAAALSVTAPVFETYCVLVLAAKSPVVITNADLDSRVAEHPKRQTIASYTGACIYNADGSPYGTLCHFDVRPHVFGDIDLGLLDAAAQLLRQHLE